VIRYKFLIVVAALSQNVLAMPQDWCVAPEQEIYETLDIIPMSGVKSLRRDKTTYSESIKKPVEIISFDIDNKITTIATDLDQKICVKRFIRQQDGRLTAIEEVCDGKVNNDASEAFTYSQNGWIRTTSNGDEQVTNYRPALGAKWSQRITNLSRKYSGAPGSINQRNFDSNCQEIGDSNTNPMTASIGNGPILGQLQTQYVETTTSENGRYKKTWSNHVSGWRKMVFEYDRFGHILQENYEGNKYMPDRVFYYQYKFDQKNNWTEKTKSYQDIKNGQFSEITMDSFKSRTLSYFGAQ